MDIADDFPTLFIGLACIQTPYGQGALFIASAENTWGHLFLQKNIKDFEMQGDQVELMAKRPKKCQLD